MLRVPEVRHMKAQGGAVVAEPWVSAPKDNNLSAEGPRRAPAKRTNSHFAPSSTAQSSHWPVPPNNRNIGAY